MTDLNVSVPSKTTESISIDQPDLAFAGVPTLSLPPALPLLEVQGRRQSCNPQKKVARSREEIRRGQQVIQEKAHAEIDELMAEFHAELPREQSASTGAIYARYSSRFQDSIGDQVRTLLDEARRKNIFIPRENVFFDLAVRGFKDRRPGLTDVRQAIARNAFDVFLIFATSRLFRRTYKALQFVEEELVERGIRVIFLKSNLDTADGENWRTSFQLFAAMDEATVRMYGSHVQAAQEGLFLRGMVCTTLPLGLTGVEVLGEFTRRNLPRRRIVIDPATAPWIRKIYEWYVIHSRSMDEIARLLNDDPDAPAPNKSQTGIWTHTLVRNHLKNPAYRGNLSYGAKQAIWSSEKDYAPQVSREKPLQSIQSEDLRIISDEMWYRAQHLLAEEIGNSGRKAKDGDRQSRPQLLRALFMCPQHERQLVVGGPQGRVQYCPLCRATRAHNRPLFTHLNRKLALQLTCNKLAELVRADDALVADIITACQVAAAEAQQPDPETLKHLRAKAKKLSGKIDYNRRNPGDTEEEQRQAEQVLKDLQREQADVRSQLASLEAATKRMIVVPEPKEIVGLLNELSDLLASADSAASEEDMRSARRIIDSLTGGRIELFQIGDRKKSRGWLQGRFNVDVVSVVMSRLTGVPVAGNGENGTEVVIDYRVPRLIDKQVMEAKRLWDQNLLNKEIASRMGCQKPYVTKLINQWFDSRGLPRVDGRRRRFQAMNSQSTLPACQQLADDVVKFMEAGLPNVTIAKRLSVSDTTVAKSIAWWFRSRGLPIPNAATRRLKLLQWAKSEYDDGRLITDIADDLHYSPRGLKLALQKYFADLGEPMVDGRLRRGNAGAGETANGGKPSGKATQ